ncbi:hypothetical protein scyTo_0012121 [Scyliorhinus torazame]|uniref:Uncharacterized protein n=1 Tax=Scyliorhinus torazame TaxID=75743 RepID=A0A401P2C7_SCYTO|nr:hypothetical protein [Scyliorhinus torazame]
MEVWYGHSWDILLQLEIKDKPVQSSQTVMLCSVPRLRAKTGKSPVRLQSEHGHVKGSDGSSENHGPACGMCAKFFQWAK